MTLQIVALCNYGMGHTHVNFELWKKYKFVCMMKLLLNLIGNV